MTHAIWLLTTFFWGLLLFFFFFCSPFHEKHEFTPPFTCFSFFSFQGVQLGQSQTITCLTPPSPFRVWDESPPSIFQELGAMLFWFPLCWVGQPAVPASPLINFSEDAFVFSTFWVSLQHPLPTLKDLKAHQEMFNACPPSLVDMCPFPVEPLCLAPG